MIKSNTDLPGSVDEEAGVAGDAVSPAEVVVVSAVHRSNPDDAVHLLGKFPPLRDSQRRETLVTFFPPQSQTMPFSPPFSLVACHFRILSTRKLSG